METEEKICATCFDFKDGHCTNCMLSYKERKMYLKTNDCHFWYSKAEKIKELKKIKLERYKQFLDRLYK